MREIIKTERLLLRRPEMDDARALAEWINHYDVVKQTGTICFPYTYLHAEYWVMISRNYWKRGKAYNFVMEHTGKVIGSLGLFRASLDAEFEVGYMLSQSYWGRGFMTEAVQGLLRAGAEDLDMRRCHAGVFSDNPGSDAVLMKLGFKKTRPDHLYSVARGCNAAGYRYICELDNA